MISLHVRVPLPSLDIDHLSWPKYQIATFFSASQEDLEKTGESVNDSVPLADGGYIAGLGVYHNIHCLRRLRIFLHSDYYYDNLTEANLAYLRGHLGMGAFHTLLLARYRTDLWRFY